MFSFWCNMFWNGLILWACMVSCNGMFDTASPVNLFHCFTCVITLCHANDNNTTWVAKNTYQLNFHYTILALFSCTIIAPYIRSCVLNWHGSSHTHKYMSTYAAWRHEHQLVKQSANYVIKSWSCCCQAAAHQLLGTTRPPRSGAMVKGFLAVIGYCLLQPR